MPLSVHCREGDKVVARWDIIDPNGKIFFATEVGELIKVRRNGQLEVCDPRGIIHKNKLRNMFNPHKE